MARPRAHELTERELEVMQVFWDRGELTAPEAREQLAATGRDLAYTTVATLIRILTEKEFLEQTTTERPFQFRPRRSFEEVSTSLVKDLVRKVFGGSREQLLLRLLDEKKLNQRERTLLQQILEESNE